MNNHILTFKNEFVVLFLGLWPDFLVIFASLLRTEENMSVTPGGETHPSISRERLKLGLGGRGGGRGVLFKDNVTIWHI